MTHFTSMNILLWVLQPRNYNVLIVGIAQSWTREEKNHCLEETEKSFKHSGEILRLIL
jgi:hypothetical protein